MPLDNNLMRNGNNAENARLDVSGIGVWGPFEAFLDIRVMHPNVPSYIDKSIDQVYIAHEKEKSIQRTSDTNGKGYIHSYRDVDVMWCWQRS